MRATLVAILVLVCSRVTLGGVGDVQTKTDHPWYPGELSCSTFARLFRTQAEAYRRATGRDVRSDEDRAIASWFWRNTHYYHCTEGARDLWGKGFGQGIDDVSREYWNGLFADGFSLCYATHAQWQGEMQALFGPGRARCCGVPGHTTFEVYLTGGSYGTGRWALLDHDVSTIYFTPDGARLMSLVEVCENLEQLLDRKAEQNRGWLPGGLHPSDPQAYKSFHTAMYAYGYAGAPPMVHLRAGESIRRYPAPGLEDGKTFVYWGSTMARAESPVRTATAPGSTSRRRCTALSATPVAVWVSGTATPFTHIGPISPAAHTVRRLSMNRPTT